MAAHPLLCSLRRGARNSAALPDRFHAQSLAQQPLQPYASEDASPSELPRFRE
jgi:hypothetical protein